MAEKLRNISEAEQLRQEIQYLTDMIGEHKRGQNEIIHAQHPFQQKRPTGRTNKCHLDNTKPLVKHKNKNCVINATAHDNVHITSGKHKNHRSKTSVSKSTVNTYSQQDTSHNTNVSLTLEKDMKKPEIKSGVVITHKHSQKNSLAKKIGVSTSSFVLSQRKMSHSSNDKLSEKSVFIPNQKRTIAKMAGISKIHNKQTGTVIGPDVQGNKTSNCSSKVCQDILPRSKHTAHSTDVGATLHARLSTFRKQSPAKPKQMTMLKYTDAAMESDQKTHLASDVSKYKWIHNSPVKSYGATNSNIQANSQDKPQHSSQRNIKFTDVSNKSQTKELKLCISPLKKMESPDVSDSRFSPDLFIKSNSSNNVSERIASTSTPELASAAPLPLPMKTLKISQFKIVKELVSPIPHSTDAGSVPAGITTGISPYMFVKQPSTSTQIVSKIKSKSVHKVNMQQGTPSGVSKYRYVNQTNSSVSKSVAKSSPSVPVVLNKYKLVHRRRSTEKYKSTKIKIEELNSIKISPAQVVKLNSRYKLVKKALKSSLHLSNHLKFHENHRFSGLFLKQVLYKSQKQKTLRSYPGAENMNHRQRKYFSSASHGGPRCGLNKSRSKYSLKTNDEGREVNINHLLGRTIENASKNKYRFIKKTRALKEKSARHYPALYSRERKLQKTNKMSPLPNRKKLSLNRRLSAKKTVQIGGFTYQSSRHKLSIRSIGASKHAKAYTWRRIPLVSAKQQAANMVIHKSMVAAARLKKKTRAVQKQYCIFYNRFGKCNRGNKCPYIHDPEKIAVCTRFLRGTCKVSNCPFSHKVAPDKMAVCTYFLRGVCNKEDCPYLHVNVSKDAAVCKDFLKGFCPRGVQCKEKHTLTCPQFTRKGSCPNGSKCLMKHIKHKTKKHKARGASYMPPSSPAKKQKTNETNITIIDDDSDVPFKDRKLPSFIALDSTGAHPRSSHDTSPSEEPSSSLHIIPRLKFSS